MASSTVKTRRARGVGAGAPSELNTGGAPRVRELAMLLESSRLSGPDLRDHKTTNPAQRPGQEGERPRSGAGLPQCRELYQMDIAGAGINDIFSRSRAMARRRVVEANKYLRRGGILPRGVSRRGARPGQARSFDR